MRAEGRLVSQHTFTEGWPSWEMHPKGDEVVICTHGAMVLTQEFPDGRRETVALEAGEYAINPPGVWHIAVQTLSMDNSVGEVCVSWTSANTTFGSGDPGLVGISVPKKPFAGNADTQVSPRFAGVLLVGSRAPAITD